jgi:DNA end-binding protein Ku
VAARSSWKGYLKFSLVSMPVKAYPATTSDGGGVKLNQLHVDCHSRINYKKTCPVHGEISNDAIVSGYEYQKGPFVIVDTDELEKLRTEDDKAVNIDTFIDPDALDPVYYAGKTYYLVPDGPVGQKPYTVLYEAMEQEKRQGIDMVVPLTCTAPKSRRRGGRCRRRLEPGVLTSAGSSSRKSKSVAPECSRHWECQRCR